MRRGFASAIATLAALGWASTAFAQEQTERYIPVGQSPGLSGVYSYQGEIEAVDAANPRITVRGPGTKRGRRLDQGGDHQLA